MDSVEDVGVESFAKLMYDEFWLRLKAVVCGRCLELLGVLEIRGVTGVEDAFKEGLIASPVADDGKIFGESCKLEEDVGFMGFIMPGDCETGVGETDKVVGVSSKGLSTITVEGFSSG